MSRRRAQGTPAAAARDGESGSVIVEFAVVLPLLVLLLTGIFEVGLLARDHQVLQNAAREGARLSALPTFRISAALSPDDVRAGIENAVVDYLASEGISVTGGDISIEQSVPIQIDDVTVRASRIEVTYDKPLFFGLLGPLVGDSVVLRGAALFRNFY
jgi:Flp pilus assembly protein TadG